MSDDLLELRDVLRVAHHNVQKAQDLVYGDAWVPFYWRWVLNAAQSRLIRFLIWVEGKHGRAA